MKPPSARAANDERAEIAAELVERDSGPGKPFRVECRKLSGSWVQFATYPSRVEAHAIAARLSAIGCPARVVATA
jgi:hypothetical protein